MDTIIDFLIDWGYWGMFVSAFFAGSFFPFSSEAVMLGQLAAGLKRNHHCFGSDALKSDHFYHKYHRRKADALYHSGSFRNVIDRL